MHECAASPASSAAPRPSRNRLPTQVAGCAPESAKRAIASGWRGGIGGASTPSMRSRHRVMMGSTRSRHASPSAPRDRQLWSSDRDSSAALPSSSGWARSISGWAHSRPWSERGSVRKNGEAAASGCTAEHTSCVTPGIVSSADMAPPPARSAASITSTERPARAMVIAAASPFGPAPTTTAS